MANQSDYFKQYYKQNKDRILQRVRDYGKDKYDNDLEFKLLKRYQSRADNYFGTKSHSAEDLLHCSPEFFVKWLKWCLRDSSRSRLTWDKVEIGHVRPVSSFDDNDLSGWCWINTLPQTQEENLEQGSDRDKEKESKHISRVIRFLKSVDVDVPETAGDGFDLQNVLSKLPFTTTHIPGELHWPFQRASFMGPVPLLTD